MDVKSMIEFNEIYWRCDTRSHSRRNHGLVFKTMINRFFNKRGDLTFPIGPSILCADGTPSKIAFCRALEWAKATAKRENLRASRSAKTSFQNVNFDKCTLDLVYTWPSSTRVNLRDKISRMEGATGFLYEVQSALVTGDGSTRESDFIWSYMRGDVSRYNSDEDRNKEVARVKNVFERLVAGEYALINSVHDVNIYIAAGIANPSVKYEARKRMERLRDYWY